MGASDILQKKIYQWNKQTETYLDKVNKELEQIKIEKFQTDGRIIAYYTYSFNMTYREGEENLIIGNFNIENTSKETINNLSICLLIQTTSMYQFSGKYTTENTSSKSQSNPVYWKQVDVDDKEGTFWFTLTNGKSLAPNEIISFSDFSLAWEKGEDFSCRVNGFVYPDQDQEGIPALNAINVHMEV